MERIRNFDDAKKILNLRIKYKPGPRAYKLDLMRRLMRYLGNPQDTYKVVHVAGTSGKTSTSYYISAMLTQAGFKVGLTISPYAEEINERVQINTVPLDETYFCTYLEEFYELLDGFDAVPSYFETLVAFSFWVYAKESVEYAVVEVGLGGLLDCTNIVSRRDKLCVITDIGFDHTNILGDTLPEIAFQKAGIIVPTNDVFMFRQTDDIMEVVRRVSRQQKAALHELEQTTQYPFLQHLPLFQQRNCELAHDVTEYILALEHRKSLSLEQNTAAASIKIPGRMDVLHVNGKTVIVDGSHNAQKIGALVKSVSHEYPHKKIATLLSFGHNKTATFEEALAIISTISSSITVTMFSCGQDEFRVPMETDVIIDYLKKNNFDTIYNEPDPTKAFYKTMAQDVDIVLVTGSFFLLNTILPIAKHLLAAKEH